MKTRGISMIPEIFPHDNATIKISNHLPQPNEIYLIESSKSLILHRYIGSLENGSELLLFKGDANRYTDEPIHKSQVLGHLVSVEKTPFSRLLRLKFYSHKILTCRIPVKINTWINFYL